jgi:hypothetical protein
MWTTADFWKIIYFILYSVQFQAVGADDAAEAGGRNYAAESCDHEHPAGPIKGI